MRQVRVTGVSAGRPCCGVYPCPGDHGGHWRVLHTKGAAGLPFGKIALEKGGGSEAGMEAATGHTHCI